MADQQDQTRIEAQRRQRQGMCLCGYCGAEVHQVLVRSSMCPECFERIMRQDADAWR